MKALAVVEEEHIANHIGFRIEQTYPDYIGSEYFTDLVADQIVDGLHLQFRRQTFLHAVDDRELGVALLGLLQQALRLVEEPRVLEGRAQRRGDRREQAQLGL